ncbi:MAG: hypothetical protein ACODAF_05780 [Actinomycetota bacterium]
MQIMRTVAAGVAALPLLACSGADATEAVCDEFAAHAEAGLPADQRAEVVEEIGRHIDGAAEIVSSNFDALQRSVDAPDSQYELAADVFAQSCFDAGWDG